MNSNLNLTQLAQLDYIICRKTQLIVQLHLDHLVYNVHCYLRVREWTDEETMRFSNSDYHNIVF